MKLLSIVIPCYNSENYMRKCIDSLLPGGEDVEIIIVDDGSHGDRTAEIADEYAALYPTVVKAVHQLNGGHGAAVNTGIRNATGLYFKVVDSDDWVKEEAYMQVLETLREQTGTNRVLDMLICNFVYEKGENRKGHELQAYPAHGPAFWLGGLPSLYQRALYIDALGYIPHKTFAGMRSGTSGTHLLCGQPVCV